jgi:hypothetical protein
MTHIAMILVLALAGQTAELRCAAPGCGGTVATGNIVVEVGNLDGVRKEMQQLVKSSGAVVRSYSEYTGNRGKRSANASYEVKKAAAQPLMDGLAGLGKLTSRNYGDQYNPCYNIESLQRKLEAYRSHLRRLLSAPGADPEIVSLLDQQIQSLESQIESYKRSYSPSSESATITVQLMERGYNQGSNVPPWLVKVAVMISLILLGLGLLAGLLVARIRSGAKPEEAAVA